MSDEKNVSKLLLIKREKTDVGDLIRDISRVTGEIATTLVILVGAVLLGRSFVRLISTNPGFSQQNLITIEFSPPGSGSRQPNPVMAMPHHHRDIGQPNRPQARDLMMQQRPTADLHQTLRHIPTQPRTQPRRQNDRAHHKPPPSK